jgi:RNA polymerase sigma factor (sigma-70 family)
VGANETTQSHAPNRHSGERWDSGRWDDGRSVVGRSVVGDHTAFDGYQTTNRSDSGQLDLTSDNLGTLADNSCCREGAVSPNELSQDTQLDQRTTNCGSQLDPSTGLFAEPQVQHRADEFVAPGWQNFDEFYQSTYPRMLRLAVALVWSKAVAEDHVQDSYAKTYARFANLDEPAAYVRKTLVNEVRIAFRRQQMMQRFAPLLRSAEFHSDRYTDDSLLKSLDSLPMRQRTAVILRYYEQCSEQEIAHALNCRPGTVKSLLSRGLASLRKVVDQ